MKFSEERAIKTGRWLANEIFRTDDINFLSEGSYHAYTELLALFCAGSKDPAGLSDTVACGLRLEWSAVLTSNLRAGAAVSFTGRYFTTGAWGWAASAGEIFSVVVPSNVPVVVESGSALNRYDTIEIRPVQVNYNTLSRQFKDPVTGLIISSPISTKTEYTSQVQVLKGTSGGGSAPTHTAGWIKVAEVYVPAFASSINQTNIKDVRDSATWTSEAGVTKARITAFMETLLDDLTVSEAQTTLGVSTFIKTLLDDADISAALSTLGVSTYIKGLLDDADVGTAQTTLGISAFIKTLLDDADKVTAMGTLGRGYLALSAGSPYTLVANSYETFIIAATTNPYVVNLPQASSCLGYRFKIVNGSTAASGLIEIAPYSGDAIGSLAANVKIYLQNVDQSGMTFRYQQIELVATVSGGWDVVEGQFCPAQGTDTNGQQYHLGKLHHLPLGNTTSRNLYNAAPPAASAWSSAISGTGVVGVPSGAKGIRVRVRANIYNTAAGSANLEIAFSDNNSNVPATYTAHPRWFYQGYYNAVGGGMVVEFVFDIPVNASGQFYVYTIQAFNCTVANVTLNISAMGFYMGD